MKNKLKICILTQTAEKVSDYYNSFFKDYDFYFVTFKKKNSNAIDFLPNSTWSDGRNRLWQEVRNKYDYYLFVDDDLIFYKAKHTKIALFQRINQKLNRKNIIGSYKKCSSDFFFDKLNYWIKNYQPEVLTVKNLNNLHNQFLDSNALYHNQFIRRVGWFDAQFTLFSNYAAEHLLPYDTSFSGWASAQILIYLISYNIFQEKAISTIDIAVNNTFHTGAYVEDYRSNLDCKNMIEYLEKYNVAKKSDLYDASTNHVNLFYGKENILDTIIDKNKKLKYKSIFNKSPLCNIKIMIDNDLEF
jgi:hypothetical protein